MTDESNLNDLQRHSAIQDARISNLETKFEMFMQSIKDSNDKRAAEMKDFKDEMRGRDDRRAAEIAALAGATDSKIESIRTTIDGMGKHVRNLAITAMVGIIAAGAGIAAMVISALTKN